MCILIMVSAHDAVLLEPYIPGRVGVIKQVWFKKFTVNKLGILKNHFKSFFRSGIYNFMPHLVQSIEILKFFPLIFKNASP